MRTETASSASGTPQRVVVVIATWLALGVLVLFELLPAWPRTVVGWAVLLFAGPAMLLVGEAAGKAMEAEPIGRWVAGRTATRRFSFLRLGYLLVRVLVTASIVLTLFWVATRDAVLSAWFHNHFGAMSNKPLQPTSGARGVTHFGTRVGAARG